jgi:hypothetical protein
MENAKLPQMEVWVVGYNQGKRSLEFGWYQVARKSWVVGQGSGKNHGHDQRIDSMLVELSLADSHSRMWRVGLALYSKDSGKVFPLLIRRA